MEHEKQEKKGSAEAINGMPVDRKKITGDLHDMVELLHQGDDDISYISPKEYSAEYADGKTVKFRLAICLTDSGYLADDDEDEDPCMTIMVAMIIDSSQWAVAFRENAIATSGIEEMMEQNPEYRFTPYEAMSVDAYVALETEDVFYDPDEVDDIFEDEDVKEKIMATAAVLDTYGENPLPYLEKAQNKIGTTGVEILDYIIHDESFIEKANRRQFPVSGS